MEPNYKYSPEKTGNLVPLYVKHFGDAEPPKNKGPIGFDLVLGDWVSPYGIGEQSDFLIQIDAPENRYTFPIVKRIFSSEESRGNNIQEDANYFFRVCTIMDDSGEIVSALYGEMHGDFWFDYKGDKFAFLYYLNPTANERNVEFDRDKNLFGGNDCFSP